MLVNKFTVGIGAMTVAALTAAIAKSKLAKASYPSLWSWTQNYCPVDDDMNIDYSFKVITYHPHEMPQAGICVIYNPDNNSMEVTISDLDTEIGWTIDKNGKKTRHKFNGKKLKVEEFFKKYDSIKESLKLAGTPTEVLDYIDSLMFEPKVVLK